MTTRKRRTALWRTALSALLAVTMAFGGMPAAALAEEAQDVAMIEGGEPVASLPVDGQDGATALGGDDGFIDDATDDTSEDTIGDATEDATGDTSEDATDEATDDLTEGSDDEDLLEVESVDVGELAPDVEGDAEGDVVVADEPGDAEAGPIEEAPAIADNTVASEAAVEVAPVEPADVAEEKGDLADAGLAAQANNSRETAKAIKFGKTYSGKISSSEHEDFYRIKLSKKAKVKVTGSFGFRFGWVNFRDASGFTKWYKSVGTSKGRSFSATVTLAKGTYYFTVECWSYTGSYRFKLSGPSSSTSKKKASVAYRVHRQTYGWEGSWRKNGSVSGTTGQAKRLEGINLKLASKPVPGGIKYRTHIQGIGWQGWRANGRLSGTTGQSRRLEAIQVRLTGSMARRYDVWYRVHAQHYGWMGWARNGQSAGTQGHAYRLEAIQVVLKAKGSKAPAASYKGAARATKARFKRGPVTISGPGWKIALPEYWRGKVTVKSNATGTTSQTLYAKKLPNKCPILTTQVLTDPQMVKFFGSRGSAEVAKGKLKGGRKVSIRMGDDGNFLFITHIAGGRYLMVSTSHFEQQRSFMGSYGPSYSDLSLLEDLQSAGKLYYTGTRDYRVPIACLRMIAKRTTIG